MARIIHHREDTLHIGIVRAWSFYYGKYAHHFGIETLEEWRLLLHHSPNGGKRSESEAARAKRYKEPVICRMYNKHDHVNVFLPILDWNDRDVKDFIEAHGIQCHPLYYDEQGKFNVKERLGCIGCPMASDNGLSDFMRYPQMVKAWCDAEKKLLGRTSARCNGKEIWQRLCLVCSRRILWRLRYISSCLYITLRQRGLEAEVGGFF